MCNRISKITQGIITSAAVRVTTQPNVSVSAIQKQDRRLNQTVPD